MDKAIESVRSTLTAAASRSAEEREEIRIWVSSRSWVLNLHDLRAFLDATKPPEPKPSELLDKLAEDMIEARRYCRSNPEHACKAAEDIETEIGHGIGNILPKWADRLATNILVGRNCLLADPEVLEGYLYAAASEVRSLADAKRNEGE